MAYNADSLICVIPRIGLGTDDGSGGNRGMAIFTYRTDDTNAVCVTANYITAAASTGVQDGDMVLAVVDEDGTIQGRIYYIANFDATNDQADLVEITAT